MANAESLRPANNEGLPPVSRNPLKDFVRNIDVIQANIERDFSMYDEEALKKLFEEARRSLKYHREMYLKKVNDIDQAPPELKLNMAWSGLGSFNLLKILTFIAESAVTIGAKKTVKDEDIFQPEQQAKAEEAGTEYGKSLGMTEKRARNVTRMSIGFTTTIQKLVSKRNSP